MRVRHQILDGPDRHRLQRVDLLVDPHRAQLRGHAGAEGGGQPDARDHRRRDAHVDERRQESGQRLDADIAQRRVALNGKRAAGGQRQEADDHDGAADHRQRACAHGDLGDQADDLLAVVHRRVRHAAERLEVEQHVVADAAQRLDRPARPPA